MAKPPPPGVPQLEDGYLRLANALVDAMIRTRMLASEKDVFLLALRQAYGFNEKEAGLSVRFVVERTGCSMSTASAALRALVDARMLEVVRERQGRTPAVYRIQKDFRLWAGYEAPHDSAEPNDSRFDMPNPDRAQRFDMPNASEDSTLRHAGPENENSRFDMSNSSGSPRFDMPNASRAQRFAMPNDQRHDHEIDHDPLSSTIHMSDSSSADLSSGEEDLSADPSSRSNDWKSEIRPAGLQALLRLSPGGVPLHYRNRLEQILDSAAERERLLPSLLAAVERTVPRVRDGQVEQRNAIGYALAIAAGLLKDPLPAPPPLAHNWSHDPEGKPLRAAAASPAPPRSPWDNILA